MSNYYVVEIDELTSSAQLKQFLFLQLLNSKYFEEIYCIVQFFI